MTWMLRNFSEHGRPSRNRLVWRSLWKRCDTNWSTRSLFVDFISDPSEERVSKKTSGLKGKKVGKKKLDLWLAVLRVSLHPQYVQRSIAP